jgi:hypothetical protein
MLEMIAFMQHSGFDRGLVVRVTRTKTEERRGKLRIGLIRAIKF